MKAIILCAGYATRLYPLTENFPKPLLTIARKEIMTHLIEKIERVRVIDKAYIVTNNKFFSLFQYWGSKISSRVKIEIVNDMTDSKEEALGAIGDLYYVLVNKRIDDDIFVMAGDVLTQFDLNRFIDKFNKKKKPVIATYNKGSKEEIKKRYGCVTFNKDKKVTSFEEKPEKPKSTYIVPPFYIYPKGYIKKIVKYISSGKNPENIGQLISYFHKKDDIFVVEIDETICDIGTLESYNYTNLYFDKMSKRY